MKYFLVIAAFLTLASCQNSSDKKSDPASNQQQGTQAAPPQGQPPAGQPPAQPPVASTLPILSFGYDEYVYDGENEIHIELLLSKPSDVPVTVDIALADGTAIYSRDYAGFMSGGNDRIQSVIFAPQQTRLDLPMIYIKNRSDCGSRFSAELSNEKQALITKASTQIILRCN